MVELHSDSTVVQHATFPGIGMKWLLPKLTEHLSSLAEGAQQIEVPKFLSPVPQEGDETISQAWLWPRMGKFFRSGDVIVAETGASSRYLCVCACVADGLCGLAGTSSFGVLDVPFPSGAILVSQILWGSIGWTVGSTLGAALAAQDLGLPRTILFVGDGSLQLTVQELSVMQKLGVKPIVFVLNNSGYTIERYLHGERAKYNDITNWRWTQLLETFGGEEGVTCKSYRVETKTELEALLEDESFARADKIQLVEMIMPMHDAPRALKVQAELSGLTNKYV